MFVATTNKFDYDVIYGTTRNDPAFERTKMHSILNNVRSESARYQPKIERNTFATMGYAQSRKFKMYFQSIGDRRHV